MFLHSCCISIPSDELFVPEAPIEVTISKVAGGVTTTRGGRPTKFVTLKRHFHGLLLVLRPENRSSRIFTLIQTLCILST